MTPYYADDTVTLYLGDCREVLPALDIKPDCVIADPPYGETSLAWDGWPDGWPAVVATVASSMWCFGSLRMFGERWSEFAGWRLSHDVVWSKIEGTGIFSDRFRRFHESVAHWYRGPWAEVYREPPRVAHHGRRKKAPTDSPRDGHYGSSRPSWQDDGTRMRGSVLNVRSMYRRGPIHPTEKPVGILDPLIRYACPPSGLVLDPFAGSGSTAEAARLSGRRAVLIEADERYCEAIARRLAADVLPIGGAL